MTWYCSGVRGGCLLKASVAHPRHPRHPPRQHSLSAVLGTPNPTNHPYVACNFKQSNMWLPVRNSFSRNSTVAKIKAGNYSNIRGIFAPSADSNAAGEALQHRCGVFHSRRGFRVSLPATCVDDDDMFVCWSLILMIPSNKLHALYFAKRQHVDGYNPGNCNRRIHLGRRHVPSV